MSTFSLRPFRVVTVPITKCGPRRNAANAPPNNPPMCPLCGVGAVCVCHMRVSIVMVRLVGNGVVEGISVHDVADDTQPHLSAHISMMPVNLDQS